MPCKFSFKLHGENSYTDNTDISPFIWFQIKQQKAQRWCKYLNALQLTHTVNLLTKTHTHTHIFNHSPLLLTSQCAKPTSCCTFQTHFFLKTRHWTRWPHISIFHFLLHLLICVPLSSPAFNTYIENMARIVSIITWRHNVTNLRH